MPRGDGHEIDLVGRRGEEHDAPIAPRSSASSRPMPTAQGPVNTTTIAFRAGGPPGRSQGGAVRRLEERSHDELRRVSFAHFPAEIPAGHEAPRRRPLMLRQLALRGAHRVPREVCDEAANAREWCWRADEAEAGTTPEWIKKIPPTARRWSWRAARHRGRRAGRRRTRPTTWSGRWRSSADGGQRPGVDVMPQRAYLRANPRLGRGPARARCGERPRGRDRGLPGHSSTIASRAQSYQSPVTHADNAARQLLRAAPWAISPSARPPRPAPPAPSSARTGRCREDHSHLTAAGAKERATKEPQRMCRTPATPMNAPPLQRRRWIGWW